MADEKELPEKQESPAEKLIAAFVNKRFTEYSRGRWAEEREWFESGMFYQMKQWLEKSTENRRKVVPVKVGGDKEKNFPMPVSDHFSKTININAGYLGFALPQMQAKADNYAAKNRRAGEAAENAIDAAIGHEHTKPGICDQNAALRFGSYEGFRRVRPFDG